MGRYILIAVDNTETAEELKRRLERVEAIEVIGYFGKPNTFCLDETHRTGEPDDRGRKFGWYCCKTCGLPRPGSQQPYNLLYPDVPRPYHGVHISVKEPWQNPKVRHGVDIIRAMTKRSAETRNKLQQRRNKSARRLRQKQRRVN